MKKEVVELLNNQNIRSYIEKYTITTETLGLSKLKN